MMTGKEVDKSIPLKLPPKDLVHLHLQGWTAIQNLRQSQVHELKRDLPANKKVEQTSQVK